MDSKQRGDVTETVEFGEAMVAFGSYLRVIVQEPTREEKARRELAEAMRAVREHYRETRKRA